MDDRSFFPRAMDSARQACDSGQEISCHAEKIILHYLYCQFYSISECILSHSLTVTVVKTLEQAVQLSFRCTVII